MKKSGIFVIFMGVFILIITPFYKVNTLDDLKLISGNVTGVSYGVLSSNKTMIFIDSYPNQVFDLGKTFDDENLQEIIKKDSSKIKIELYVAQDFYNKNKQVIPAFYGLKVNNFILKTNEEGMKINYENKIVFLFLGPIFLIIGGFLHFYLRKKYA